MFSNIISTEDLDRFADESWVICDCRFTLTDPSLGKKAYLAAHISNSIYVDLESDLSSSVVELSGRHPLPKVKDFCEKLGLWGIAADTQVVVYDDSFGSIAARMWWLLRWIGHEKIAILDGGWQKWKRESRSVDNKIPLTNKKPSYMYSIRDDMTVNAEALMNLGENSLIDARAEERFTGNIEPFDKVAGHVPGAKNLPFEDNLDIDGTFLKGEELLEIYKPILKDKQYEQIIMMCGSGVTACHSIAALEAAGVGMVRLYPGSWSEWITDSNRPVATGEI